MTSYTVVPSSEEIGRRLERALRGFAQEESDLIQRDPSERALTHRLAFYIEREFLGWSVDCEYNRVGRDQPKEIFAKRTS